MAGPVVQLLATFCQQRGYKPKLQHPHLLNNLGKVHLCVYIHFFCLPVHEPVRIAYDRPRGRPVTKKKVSMAVSPYV